MIMGPKKRLVHLSLRTMLSTSSMRTSTDLPKNTFELVDVRFLESLNVISRNLFINPPSLSCLSKMKANLLYTLPNNTSVIPLNCDKAFNGLMHKERLYAHYLGQASWYGSLIVFVQTSPESPLLFALIHKMFLLEDPENLRKTALDSGITEDEFTAFLVYFSGVLSNAGNYKSFGDTKFIPNLPQNKFELIVKKSKAYRQNPKFIQSLLDKVLDIAYSLEDNLLTLGFGPNAVTTYFSSNCTKEDAKLVNEFMEKKLIEKWNTRFFKTPPNKEGTSKLTYEIRFPSIKNDNLADFMPMDQVYKGAKFTFKRGDYDLLLKPVVENLKKAKEFVSNDIEAQMLDKYVAHFTSGSLQDHKEGSRFWIKNKGPVVETYIGFIENYRDPDGQRAEFEGFVSIVDKELSKKFEKLVENAEEYLPLLPWGKDFEQDNFLKPDYTSLDVLAFAGSSVPVGINIPNYEDITQNEGFKNVNLGNVISASMRMDVIPFLSEDDKELIKKHILASYEITTALHELLGHGSGKLFKKVNGSFNFDKDNLKNPLTGESVETFYDEGQSFAGVFDSMSSAYEECRAEAVSLYLSLEKEILKIFEVPESDLDDVIYVGWLEMMWNGCAKCLESYDPLAKRWTQSHSQARYILMRVCLEAGEGFLKVEEIEEGTNLLMTLDRSKLCTVGKRAMGDFLRKMQIYRATADVERAKLMFNKYSEVPETGSHPWAKWRDIVLAHKQPRRILVQPNTFISESGRVELKSYEPTFAGLIQSFVDRFPKSSTSDDLITVTERDTNHFRI